MTSHDVLAGSFAARLVDRLSTVALLVLLYHAKTSLSIHLSPFPPETPDTQAMPKRSPANRDFRDYGDNGERKIKKSKESASSATSNVDEDLVRSFCLFSVMAPLFTFSRIRGKLI